MAAGLYRGEVRAPELLGSHLSTTTAATAAAATAARRRGFHKQRHFLRDVSGWAAGRGGRRVPVDVRRGATRSERTPQGRLRCTPRHRRPPGTPAKAGAGYQPRAPGQGCTSDVSM